ncbi:hypothetical protein [Rhizobium sp. C4]|uniref:hypothetical protein n=1 Tax=Rhizobium sp. C4 TaxID=1349800 RepID=UPI001E2C03A8|nr:hypothetical protein [Rhizobium sp. C4]MCD2173987.1 hypothetical protein [Rhizobium sp. C4]
MHKIDINRITLGICFIVVVGIAAAKDYRVEIGGGTFKFEKNVERDNQRPPVEKASR